MHISPFRPSLSVVALLAVAASMGTSGCNTDSTGATDVIAERTGSSSAPVRVGVDPTRLTAEVAAARPKLLPGAKTKVLAAAGDKPYDKTFDDLRFEMVVGEPFRREMLPESIEKMAGQRIRIRGYILPTPQKRGIRQFVLVRDNQVCCFGPGAALYDCILVEMQPGKTVEFSIFPVAVDGTFDIQEFKGPDGKHLAIYHMDGESVR
jgi:hypothetical protein